MPAAASHSHVDLGAGVRHTGGIRPAARLALIVRRMPARHRPRSARPSRPPAAPDRRGERLQKILAAAGFGSRRQCEELIVDGRVEVDRKTVTELGTRADPAEQEIRVDGEPLKRVKRLTYLLNKPVGVLCTNRDPQGRTRVIDLLPPEQRLFTIGRLDRSSEGLILVTNDGELANRLAHPRYGVEKTYRVRVAGQTTAEELEALRKGVRLAEGLAKVKQIRVRRRFPHSTELEIVLNEGRNREIRRILAKVGHKVMQLRRVAIGPLRMEEDFPSGAYRLLSLKEVHQLLDSVVEVRGGAAKGRRSAATKTVRGKQTSTDRRPAGSKPSTGTVLAYGDEPAGDRRRKKKHARKQSQSSDPKRIRRRKGKR